MLFYGIVPFLNGFTSNFYPANYQPWVTGLTTSSVPCCSLSFLFLFFEIYFIDYAITVVPFFLPFIPLHPVPHLPPSFPHLGSCPWVVHVSSLVSPFSILFLSSPCLFCTCHLCFLFPVPFLLFSPLPSPLITFHLISTSVNLFLL